MKKKAAIVLAIMAIIFAFQYFGLGAYFTLDNLKSSQDDLALKYQQNPVLVIGVYMAIYIISTALSLPGATILTLAGGAIFGFLTGLVLVSFASTIGATLAFLVSRFLLRDSIQKKFSDKLQSINKGIEKEGAFYLFTLRLLPVFPFFLINLVMGLMPIRTITFFFVSQVGMLAGTAVYVNAGTQLAKIDSLKGIISPSLIGSFVLIGILPLLSKKLVRYFKSRKYVSRYKKPAKYNYNLIAIGAGSAGLVTSYIAAAVKAKVALIERNKMGGDCLNTGCVPSKALIRTAKIVKYMHRAQEFGLEVPNIQFQFAKVMERVQRVIKEIEPHDSIERYSGLGVECITGDAKIISPYEVQVNGKILTTKNIVIATGARPFVPPIPGLKDVPFLTSDNVWSIRELPMRLVVLGGGPIGSELAQSFARLGSQVTQIEMASRIMAREDIEVSDYITKVFKQEGIKVFTQHKAVRVENTNGTKVIICENQGKEVRVEFDQILLAIGRKANTTGFGLEELEIELDPQGTIATDEFLCTTRYPNIYACGDVAGPYQFTHTAAHQAWYASVNSLFAPFKRFKADYRVIPWCTFTDPEVARVGINEQEAKERGMAYVTTKEVARNLEYLLTLPSYEEVKEDKKKFTSLLFLRV